MNNLVKRIYKFLQVIYLFLRNANKRSLRVGIFKKMSMLSKGFFGESNVIYQFNQNNYKDYLSDYKRLKSKFINGRRSDALNDKLIFERIFKDSIKIPKSYALITKGKIIPLDGGIKDTNTLLDYMSRYKNCVIKPVSGGGGHGVILLKMIGDKLYANDKPITIDDLSKRIAQLDNYFISEFIQQGEFSSQFNPSTLNSMRVVTMIDPDTNKAFIPIAVQRIGTNKSAPADNWTQGGISAEIDVESGVIGKGVSYPNDDMLIWHDKHPDTNSDIEGVTVPDWDGIKKSILNVANKHPYIKYVGWDIVLTDDGIMVIEGNNCSDVNLLQIHRPLLKHEKAKKFYKYHDVI